MQRYADIDTVRDALYEADAITMKGVRILNQFPTITPDEVRGVGEITDDDACPVCGCWIPTDDAHDAIFKNEVKFCYYCGTRLRMKGGED